MKKIEKPNFELHFMIYNHDVFYHDDVNNIYYVRNNTREDSFYFNNKGQIHNENGFAHLFEGNKTYYLNNLRYNLKNFSRKTKHLICRICEDFCKQECFL